MKPTAVLSLVLTLLLTLGAALAQQTDEATAAIEDLGQQWQDLYNQGDMAAVAEFYTEDATFYTASGEVFEGREAIQEGLQSGYDEGATEITIETIETEVMSDVAHGIGRYTLMSADGQTVGEGYYVVILHRMDDQWMIHRHLSNMILPEMEEGDATGGTSQSTDEAKIADAMSAGPLAISQDATIMDWPSEAGGEYRVLREGSNGWVCFTSSPRAVAAGMHDAFCDDEVWQEWGVALGEGRDPVIEQVGISYMLLGDAGLSNTDPFATEPTEDNDWHVNGPHVMILLPDASLYEHYSTDPHNGGPFIMFPNTPYAHIMIPVTNEEHQ